MLLGIRLLHSRKERIPCSLALLIRYNPSGARLREAEDILSYGIEKDIAKLADILGHSSIDTTRIYIMTTGTEHRRKIERLGLVV